jgi:chromosome segregation protein
MHLIKIKLAGFKSFVDPTTLIVSGNLVGIVGPNGCGKSNIIDAVTWVMGESSAKHLRGDSLTDVIFNGSRERQPVGQASVELIFDNSEGKLGGQYASYSEISIKRQINREGISLYTLNGSRCRRRDIQAIFLGTGLGPRSYSIIEQGVISRLVEAKPEELRTFIEEAAGISKYRERRRETENRMRHTRENLDRLNDLREELGKQLGHLKRQANAAERYKILKQEERNLAAELRALDWQELKQQFKTRDDRVQSEATRVEQGIANLRKVESEIELQRDTLAAGNERLNQAQSDFYRIGGEISQLEQKIQHTGEKIQALEAELANTAKSLLEIREQQQADQQKFTMLSEKSGDLEPQLRGSRDESNRAYDALNHAEQAMQGWQTEWDACNQAVAGFARQIEVDGNRLQYLQTALEEYSHRRTNNTAEMESIDTDTMSRQLADLSEELQLMERSMQQGRAELESRQQEIPVLRTQIQTIQHQLAEKRSRQQKLEGKKVSLEALQQHAAGTDHGPLVEWLASNRLEQAPRLLQQLTVEPEWTQALETVLGQRLQDICVGKIENIFGALGNFSKGTLGFMENRQASGTQQEHTGRERLLDKVDSAIGLEEYLQDIYLAPDLEAAVAIRNDLQAHESVVTPDGIWLGSGWARLSRQDAQQSGVLLREQQIKELELQIIEVTSGIRDEESRLDEAGNRLELAEQKVHSLQQALNTEQGGYAGMHSRYAELKTRLEQSEKRRMQLAEELEEIELQEEEDSNETTNLQQRLDQTIADKQQLDEQRSGLSEMRDRHRIALETARSQWQITHEQSHEIALQLESISSQRASYEQAIQRTRLQITNLETRSENLAGEIKTLRSPLADLGKTLEARLDEKIGAEKTLSGARNHVQTIDTVLRQKELERTEVEQQVQELRTRLEEARFSAQETRVRLQTVQEQLQSMGHNAEELLKNIDEGAEQQIWRERLENVERKIQRLGPINLAAIDEFNQLSERKEYMDRQNDDLIEALQTLENAIHKIDRETRTRFRETFDALNQNLKEMFPVLFGGGHAYLALTGEDLLQTGVTLMAQPPGKRNSTIHLLSGGEKALTAVALVFAIFKLNPAPFCILDEVDAPLDDTNVGRFSELVRKMSTEIQFIFITHNKITMEIAQQLLGVTMHEAGVSRLVSVDMDEAIQIAASA